MTQFTTDWIMHQTTLGEGAYGEVKLLINKNTNEKVACKLIHYKQGNMGTIKSINKEVLIHNMLNHENVIRFYGRNRDNEKEYIFLEFAARGELFQMIEPDIGMPSGLAQRYMKQLINGVSYLHSKGVVHRDIKPENLLINERGVLKISDFGLATLFRCKEKERMLDKRCGTKPYSAPEVLQGLYRGPPVDIWSCGVVLLAMLSGELPWSDTECLEFRQYKQDMYITLSPWNKLGNMTLALIRKILCINPRNRITITEMQIHPWMHFVFNTEEDNLDGNKSDDVPLTKRRNSMVEKETRLRGDGPQVTLSQPTTIHYDHHCPDNGSAHNRDVVCFSQPAEHENMFICSQFTQFTQTPVTRDNFNVIKRMMRFFVTTNYEKTMEMLKMELDNLQYMWHMDHSGGAAVTVATVDGMKNQLTFKVNALDMDGRILVDFRLSKGCGLEFKKKFIKIKYSLMPIIDTSI